MVSIIIPVYNVENYLRECLDSILNQTLKDIEIICVDDGSTDGSLDILREYAEKDSRIRILQQANLGAGVARNAAIDIARGEYLFFCDADDFCAPDLFAQLTRRADDTKADVVFFHRTRWSDQTRNVAETLFIPKRVLNAAQPFAPQAFSQDIITLFGPQPWNKLVRREYINKKNIRYQPLPRMNDVLFSALVVAEAERIATLPIEGYYHRIEQAGEHLQSQSGNNRTPYIAFEVYEELRRQLKDRGLFKMFSASFYRAAESTFAYSLRTVDDFELLREILKRATAFMRVGVEEGAYSGQAKFASTVTLEAFLKRESTDFPVCAKILKRLQSDAPTARAIAMICDEAYTAPCIVALTSFARNCPKASSYVIHFCANDMSEESIAEVLKLRKAPWKLNIQIHTLDLSAYRSIYVPYDGNTGAGSITAFAKFDLPQILKEDKVLYLDGDILVLDDLAPLFELSLKNVYAAGVRDSGRLYNDRGLRGKLKSYFNSGVMMLNLRKMREDNCTARLIDAKIALNDIKLVDQDAFNIVFDQNFQTLPIRWNALMVNLNNSVHRFSMPALNRMYETRYSSMYALEEDLAILHFASKEKPWKYTDVRYAELWKSYYDLSPISERTLERTTFKEASMPLALPSVVPVVLAADETYLPYAFVTIRSALEARRSSADFEFKLLLPKSPSNEARRNFEELVNAYPRASIEFLAMGDAYRDITLHISHITSPTFYRLDTPSLFPQYDKIVYLDCDVIVESDLAEFLAIDLGSNLVAGVKAAAYVAVNKGAKYGRDRDIPEMSQYINAGVLLMNLKAMREEGLEEEFRRRAVKGYRGQDQDVINGACYGRILHLPYAYNCQKDKYDDELSDRLAKVFEKKEILTANNCPRIIHFSDNVKPWHDVTVAMADRWWRHALKTPYAHDFLFSQCESIVRNGAGANQKLLMTREDQGNSEALKQKMTALKAKKLSLEKEVTSLRQSATYRIGLFITWPVRRVCRFLARQRSNKLSKQKVKK